MAKARAICTCATCGETFEKTATKNNSKAAAEWEAWAAENITTCPDCWAKMKKEEAMREIRDVFEVVLPSLEGSPKQIEWAESIRGAFADNLVKSIRQTEAAIAASTNQQVATKGERGVEAFRRTSARILQNKSASWWIDIRDEEPTNFIMAERKREKEK